MSRWRPGIPQSENAERMGRWDVLGNRRRQHEERLHRAFQRLDHAERLRGVIVADRVLALFRDADFSFTADEQPGALELLRVMNGTVPGELPADVREAVLQVNTKVAIALAATGGTPELALIYAAWSLEALR